MDNEEKYKKLIRAIKVLRELKPHDECLENWIKENAPEIADSEDERIIDNLASELKNLLVRGLIKDETYVKYGNFLKSLKKSKMQNGIIINGVEYELIEDRDDDECERCALSEICHDARKEVICNPIFGDLSISHRFDKRK